MRDKTYRYKRKRRKANRLTQKPEIRKEVFERDNYKCLKCGSKENLTLDHIIPVFLGGKTKVDNLQTLCNSCNAGKAPRDTTDYREGEKDD